MRITTCERGWTWRFKVWNRTENPGVGGSIQFRPGSAPQVRQAGLLGAPRLRRVAPGPGSARRVCLGSDPPGDLRTEGEAFLPAELPERDEAAVDHDVLSSDERRRV